MFSMASRSGRLTIAVLAALAFLISGARGAWARTATLPSELLFVPNGNNLINIYALHDPNKLGPLAQITAGLCGFQYQETVDKAGDLFVVNSSPTDRNCQYIAEYAPPYNGNPKILTGFLLPLGVAVDAAGTVYASNCGAYCSQTPTIYVYANGSTTPTSSITSSGFSDVGYLAVDKTGNLFGPNSNRATGASDVFEIPAGSTIPKALHLKGLFNLGGPGVGSVAVTPLGDLFVENDSNMNYVLGFKPGAQVAYRIIDPFRFLDTPGGINFGPNGDLYVPINCANQSCEGSVVGFRFGNKPAVTVGPPGPGISGVATLPNANLLQQAWRPFDETIADWPNLSPTWRGATARALPRPFGQRKNSTPARHGGGWLSAQARSSTHLVYLSIPYITNSVNIYPARGQDQPPIGVLTSGVSNPQGIGTDSSGNLYVANSGNSTVTVYPPGQTNPSATYTTGVGTPYDVKVGSDGTVYVANVFAFSNGDGSVTEYTAGSLNPSTTLTVSGQNAVAVALDASNNLYVSWYSQSSGAASVYKYAPGSSTGTNLGLNLPAGSFPIYGLAFDHSGNLVMWYESLDHSIGYLAAFAPGQTQPSITLQGGSFLDTVAGIAFPRDTHEIYLANINRNTGVRLTYPRGIPLDVFGNAQAAGVALSPGT